MFKCRHLALVGLLSATGLLVAGPQPPAKDDPKADPNGVLKKPAPPTGRPMELGECLAIAEQRHPHLRAAYHSLRAAELGLQGLNGLGRVADRLSPDLPVRRQQSMIGLRVAQAEVDKVRQEITSDVCEMYFSHVYARQSEQTAFDVLEQLDSYYQILKDLLNSGVADKKQKLTAQTLFSLQVVIAEVRVLRLQATTGRRKSLAALRQAMGVGPECDFHPATEKLPIMGGELTEAQVVTWALARRPEITQAATAAEVFQLETCAQAMVRFRPLVNTLAAGTDLHSHPVPQALRNGVYRPGGINPEMPNGMVGKRDDRVARAGEYAARQSAQYEDVVGLVRLEAENAFIDWDAATERVTLATQRFESARRALEEGRVNATVTQDVQPLATSEAAAGKAQADYVQAVFEHLKVLIKLERVTAGAISPAYPGRFASH